MNENIGNAKLAGATLDKAVDGVREYGRKVLAMSRTSVDAAFDYAQQVIGAKSASEITELSIAHARKQLANLTAQTSELNEKIMAQTSELSQKIAETKPSAEAAKGFNGGSAPQSR